MNDTSPEFEAMYREKLMVLSGEERLAMATGMFELARNLVLASLPQDLTPEERKYQLLLRFYGHELTAEEKEWHRREFYRRAGKTIPD